MDRKEELNMRVEAYTQVQQLYGTKTAKAHKIATNSVSDRYRFPVLVGYPDCKNSSYRKQ